MHVLVLHSELGVLRGGGENFTRNLFTAFASRGHRVSAAFVADHSGKYPIALPSVIHPLPISGWWSRNLGQVTLSSIGGHISLRSQRRQLWERLQEAISWRVIRWHNQRFQSRVQRIFSDRWDQFDAVYVHGDPQLAYTTAPYRPTVLRLPGPVSAELSPLLRKIQAVCANGDALEQMRQFLGERAIELPVGLDEQLFHPGSSAIRSRLRWSESDKVIGYVGRLTPIKGVDLLATAFVELAQHDARAKLIIIGGGNMNGSLRTTLANALKQNRAHIEDDVPHQQLPEWYRAMDLFVMPSRYENFSNAILEAMACGVPVIASETGGNRKLLGDPSEWLFEANSVSSLTEHLANCLKNQDSLRARAEKLFRRIRQRYSWAASAERLEVILSQI